MMIFAKPTGVPLDVHRGNVLAEMDLILTARPFVIQKYRRFVNADLREHCFLSADMHDDGKADERWQGPCRKDFEEYEQCKRSGKKFRARYLMKSGVRHEFISLEHAERKMPSVPLPVKAAIAAHHGKLGEANRDRWYDGFKKFWLEFQEESEQAGEKFESSLRKRYEYAGPRYYLQFADHRASAREANNYVPELTKPFSYDFPYRDANEQPLYRGVQKIIQDIWDDALAILRAATGAGKTDASLLWAQRQILMGRADRLVIAMPTRFTANALAISSTESLSQVGLHHSTAWFQHLKDNPDISPEEKGRIDKEQELARRLETPVTVTTIDHLCISLTGVREEHHATFFNLAHSCVVIDEADFYDSFTQQNIVILLRALKTLQVPVLIMSATIPESGLELYSKSGLVAAKIHEDRTNSDVPRCRLSLSGTVTAPSDIEELLTRAMTQPTIIYANTVARAQKYYQWFKKRDFKDVVIYHSRFTETDKVNKEALLIEMLGKEAWLEERAHGVVILTQIGEMSVNISADFMISEICPIDRLAQRVGRLSRFADRNAIDYIPGELYIIEPYEPSKKTGVPEFYPAPYGSPDNGIWKGSDAIQRTRELLKEEEYSSQAFVDLVNEVYSDLPHIDSDTQKNITALLRCIKINWLILPRQSGMPQYAEDDRTEEWKCRDIDHQYTVYVKQDMMLSDESAYRFTSSTERQLLDIRFGVKIHAHEFKRAVRDKAVFPMTIFTWENDEHGETIWAVKPQYYDPHTGLDFKNNENE